MDTVLLDTNIVSFLFKHDSRIKYYQQHLEGKIHSLSFMTVAELFQWAYVRNWGITRTREMKNELRKYLIFPFDITICQLWAQIRANCRKVGQPISPQDAWIAATAQQHKIPLVTHNPDDFQMIEDLVVISEV